MKTALLTTLLTLISPPTAFADVNMMEGSFRKTFVDADVEHLKIERRYDSRSNFTGLFGFGWCSTFDSKLIFGKTLKLADCGKLSAPDNIRYANAVYEQTLPTGLIRTFDAESGLLKSLKAPGGRTIGIERTRLPRAAALVEGDLPKMRLEFDDLHEVVTALTLPAPPDPAIEPRRLTYEYSADRNLLSAKNSWNNTYSFTYDSLHNLIRIDYPDRTKEDLTYDSDRDQLTKYIARNGCSETYDHQVSASKNSLRQISSARLICPSRPVRDVRYDFTFAHKATGWSLQKLTVTKRGP